MSHDNFLHINTANTIYITKLVIRYKQLFSVMKCAVVQILVHNQAYA